MNRQDIKTINRQDIAGTISHHNAQGQAAFKRWARLMHRSPFRRAKHHLNDALRHWRRGHDIAFKIVEGKIR